MQSVKDIKIKVLPAKIANDFVKKVHYSKSVMQNSTLHFGAFLNGMLHGVMQFGNPIDKRKVINLVHTKDDDPVKWNEMLELNRMAFDDTLPKNSESRSIAVAIKLIKKNAPHIKWILSFADGTQCGDGTIYRASGFYLTNINKNKTIGISKKLGKVVAIHGTAKHKHGEVERLEGFQLRYIYLIDKSCKITVPIIPFSDIEKAGAKMHKGMRASSSKVEH